MFRRDTGRFSRMMGLFYILFQYIGGLAGGILIFDVLDATARLGIDTDTTGATWWS